MPDSNNQSREVSRREFVLAGATTTAGLILAACAAEAPEDPTSSQSGESATPVSETGPTPGPAEQGQNPVPTQSAGDVLSDATSLPPTPACDDDDDPTPAQTAGPFYTPDTPGRVSFWEDRTGGARLIVSGQVLSTDCEPLAGAILDFWHADESGAYDNAGFRFRGHQFTDQNGFYRLETVMPGLYPGRTRHIHVKVQGSSTSLLTTQMYFPGEPANASDGIFDPQLLMGMDPDADGFQATFDFVLRQS